MELNDQLNVIQKIGVIQSELTGLKKDSSGFNYNYLSLNKLVIALNPHLSKHGLTVCHDVVKKDGDWVLCTTVSDGNIDNDVIAFCPLLGFDKILSGKMNLMQAIGAAITYARRYNLLNIFNLFASDDDAECLTVKSDEKKQSSKKSEKINLDNPGDYVCPAGEKMKGKKLSKIDVPLIINAVKNMTAMLDDPKQSKLMDNDMKTMRTMCMSYLTIQGVTI